MDAKYELNATHISLLHQKIKIHNDQITQLHEHYESLAPAYRFMKMIIDALKDNVGLQDEWLVFLDCAGISEPEWKSDYISSSVYDVIDEY